MPRQLTVEEVREFNKGLFTEATALNYPKGVAKDLDNIVLNRDGSAQRRLGLAQETGGVDIDTGNSEAVQQDEAVSTYRWDNVNNDPTLSFGVVQNGDTYTFLDLGQDAPTANIVGTLTLTTSVVQVASLYTTLNGNLIITNRQYGLPQLVKYTSPSTFTATDISLEVRDYWGVDDGLANNERPNSLDVYHRYNLLNQGWTSNQYEHFSNHNYRSWSQRTVVADISEGYTVGDKVLASVSGTDYVFEVIKGGSSGSSAPTWTAGIGDIVIDNVVEWRNKGAFVTDLYPSNADIPVKGAKLGDNGKLSWDPENLFEEVFGDAEAPKGHFRISPFKRLTSRHTNISLAVPGPPTLGSEDLEWVGSAEAFSGRIFYSAREVSDNIGLQDTFPNLNTLVMFSQVTDDETRLGKCYQRADPTSSVISDLRDDDGGYIVIPEASIIYRLVATEKVLYVFAENGVWAIHGGDRGFSARAYQVEKVSNVGCINAESVVNAEGTIFYWSKAGIYALGGGERGVELSNLSEPTIQSYYLSLPTVGRANAVGMYDSAAKKVRWLCNNNSSTNYDGITFKQKYNTELVYDVSLGAFYKHSFSEDNQYLAGYLNTPNYAITPNVQDVVDGGIDVVDGVEDVVDTQGNVRTEGQSATKYLYFIPATTYTFSLAELSDTTFNDFTSTDYSSYIITGANLVEDGMRDKQAVHVVTNFLRTETGFTGTDDLEAVDESSCFMQARWEWSNSSNSGRWSTASQVYRLKRLYLPTDATDTFDYGFEVVQTKSKLRGHGKALSLHFYSEAGKNFHLLGWGVMWNTSGNV